MLVSMISRVLSNGSVCLMLNFSLIFHFLLGTLKVINRILEDKLRRNSFSYEAESDFVYGFGRLELV